ncbi:ATP-binding protein [Candidatus Peregrinibacteria bacterium]|jgi:anti-sigma regulatory factor (Ser/Thr protein kinase)|nr:ATP-binding protein [Candidatus Peregrinibacteria bacterium]MBT4631867.1 ATP-binding protein [Candidatus Peregrinibacteria bacterium]MBT5517019.1 ATP-binding protein [Candidatus Peregrinibacteria bacterium]MBT5824212.1 ATP-binding protein [Candidatus Peregrinibacteria bacterium]
MEEEKIQNTEKPLEITVTIPTQAYFLSGIRDFILNFTKNVTGFSDQWAFRFQAVVDELCNNAIEHGSAAGQTIEIVVAYTPSKYLEVFVKDNGSGTSKMTAKQMTDLFKERVHMTSGEYLGFRGRGLPKIVGEWTDEVVFEDKEGGGLVVRAKKYLRKEDEEVSSLVNDPTHLILK